MHARLLAALVLLAAASAGAAETRRPARARPPQKPIPSVAPAAEPLSVRPVRPRERRGRPGAVVFVAAGRAYLDAGARDGLAEGAVLSLTRAGRPVGSCTVELLSDRSATCLGEGVRPGDAFALAAPPAAARPAVLAPAVAPEEQARRLAAVEAAAFSPVEYRAARSAEVVAERIRRAGAEVALVHASWIAGDARSMHQERAEVRLAGAEIAPGWRVFLDAAGVHRTALSETERFRPADRALFLVREAQVSAREAGGRFALAAGRVLPWRVVGAGVFDGVQAGWRPSAGSEVGIFGGGMPEPETTAPTLQRATGGAYLSLEQAVGASLFRQETRLAWARTPEAGSRLEAEALGQARLARLLDLSGQVRFGFGGVAAPSRLDAARLDLGTWIGGRFSLWGSFRYQGLSLTDVPAPALFPAALRHLDAAAGWEVHPGVTVRIAGGYARDLGSRLDRGWAGPEVAAPRLFGAWGGLSAGYAEERGWLDGRSAWVQGDFQSRDRGVRAWTRLSWLSDTRPGLPSTDTVGLSMGGLGELADWLRLRLSLLARLGVPAGGEGATPDLGLSAVGALEVSY